MTEVEKKDNYIKPKSIETIGLSSIAFLILLLAFVFLDNVYEKDIKIINHSESHWFIASVTSFIISIIVAFLLYFLIGKGKKVRKFFLYLFTIPISIFIFSAVNCSGGLYSPFLSLYALIFTGAIIITDSPKAIIFMIVIVLFGLFLHLRFNTEILIDSIPKTAKSSEIFNTDCSTVLNNEVYQIKYAVIIGIVFLEMMLAELFSYTSNQKARNVIETVK